MKLKIKKGDTVKVIAGNYKGQQGKVLSVVTDKNRAVVEGINMVHKHTKPNAASPNGGIIKKEASVHISNLMLLHNGNPTRVGRRLEGEKLVRFAKKTGEIIK